LHLESTLKSADTPQVSKGMANNPKSKPSGESPSVFTTDPNDGDTGNMPSVTRLLNRKSLGLLRSKAASSPPSRPIEKPPLPPKGGDFEESPEIESLAVESTPTITSENPGIGSGGQGQPRAISLSISADDTPIQLTSALESAGAEVEEPAKAAPKPAAQKQSIMKPTLKIQQAIRKPQISPLIIWDPNQLDAGTDPLGKGILQLLRKGAHSALFLAITPPAPGGQPIFIATAAVLAQQNLNIWTGLRWNPALTPEIWNPFLQTGWIEFPPPSAMTVQSSLRNIIRVAFGISPTEWLLLLRAGPPNHCRGAVAILSKESLISRLTEALPLFAAPAPQTPGKPKI
jgi:hypothetical protein